MSTENHIKACQQVLIDLSILRDCVKHAHWFIPGGALFYQLHKMFDLFHDGDESDGGYASLDEHIDDIGEQIARLNGITCNPQEFYKYTCIQPLPTSKDPFEWLRCMADNYSRMKTCICNAMEITCDDNTINGRLGELLTTIDYALMYFTKSDIKFPEYELKANTSKSKGNK